MKILTIAACAALAVLLGSLAPASAVPPQEEYESAFIAIRDSIGLQAYSGCLKGPEGVQRDGYLVDGEFHEFVLMSILEDEWRATRAGSKGD